MPGLVPPARPKPLRRGEGPGIHVLRAKRQGVDGRDKPGHDGWESSVPQIRLRCTYGLRLSDPSLIQRNALLHHFA
ncbi:hypothetical protein M2427_006724 [Bradyrhizobium sp. BR13661]|jgi:hypothetical protein|nr:hypothetical protein [Bradyrhizobium sp. BR13661]